MLRRRSGSARNKSLVPLLVLRCGPLQQVASTAMIITHHIIVRLAQLKIMNMSFVKKKPPVEECGEETSSGYRCWMLLLREILRLLRILLHEVISLTYLAVTPSTY